MIILDTNVLAELMKASPDPRVVEWLDRQEGSALYLTTITLAEILYGLSALPAGKRRSFLEEAFQAILRSAFADRMLPFDEEAARHYGPLLAQRRALGRPISQSDCQIAGIVLARRSILATRNIRDFEHCGLTVVDPFAAD